MKSREEAAAFVQSQFTNKYKCTREKGYQHHYGIQNLRELLDFIYEGEPKSEAEIIGLGEDAWRD